MPNVNTDEDRRRRYDTQRDVVRSVFGDEAIVTSERERNMPTRERARRFLEDNEDVFELDNVVLEFDEVVEGSAQETVRFEQRHGGVPVYEGRFTVSSRKGDGRIVSAVSDVVHDLSPKLGEEAVEIGPEEAVEIVYERLGQYVGDIEAYDPTLYVYRHRDEESPGPPKGQFPMREELLSMGDAEVGEDYLAWEVLADTDEPDGAWSVFVDATDGEVRVVKDRRVYASRKGYVFHPDPITSSGDTSLTWSTSQGRLNSEREEVTLENLDSPTGGTYELSGSYVVVKDINSPSDSPPTTSSDFKYDTKTRDFRAVMSYYYVDEFVEYARQFNVGKFNTETNNTTLSIDHAGLSGSDNSYFQDTGSDAPYIAHGEGGVPDASDAAVIIHEFGHALHYFLGVSGYSGYEEGMSDFLAACWLDRYNEGQHQRAEVFPWDNNSNVNWGPKRDLSRPEKFDDANFNSYGSYLKGDIFATALWEVFLDIGGQWGSASVRENAADTLIEMYMEAVASIQKTSPPEDLVNALIQADKSLNEGLHRKVIWDAFRRRGLWADKSPSTIYTPNGNTDTYIRDNPGDAGDQASDGAFYRSPDVWVRTKKPSNDLNPGGSHQQPIVGQKNYVYVRVKNRGSDSANGVDVELFSCNPGTSMTWPTHFNSEGTKSDSTTIPAGGSIRIGPFEWTPTNKGHACLLAAASRSDDDTVLNTVTNPTPNWQVVQFDNNVGQDNVHPRKAVAGSKVDTSFVIRGGLEPTHNDLVIDAREFPTGTLVTARLPRGILEAATLDDLELVDQNNRYATVALDGCTKGTLRGFELDNHEEWTVDVEIELPEDVEPGEEFSVAFRQIQNGVPSGQVTVSTTVVEESSEGVFGNIASEELHTPECPYWGLIDQRHKRPMASVEEGLQRGYDGCAFCLGEHHTD